MPLKSYWLVGHFIVQYVEATVPWHHVNINLWTQAINSILHLDLLPSWHIAFYCSCTYVNVAPIFISQSTCPSQFSLNYEAYLTSYCLLYTNYTVMENCHPQLKLKPFILLLLLLLLLHHKFCIRLWLVGWCHVTAF